jgi:predicted ATPase/DNA-binding winged helix-turn-helix (wHTH) protein
LPLSGETVYRFGPFCLDVPGRALMKDGGRLVVGGRAFDVLVALVRCGGGLAAKSELLEAVWPGVAVEENNLTTQVLNLRKLLSHHDPNTTYIATDAGRGYRFVAAIHTGDQPAPAPAARSESETQGKSGLHHGAQPDPRPAAERHNLPGEITSFVGREREIADLVERLRHRMLLTLVGSGGVGKTRCALRVAERALAGSPQGAATHAGATASGGFVDGVWLVELASLPSSNPNAGGEQNGEAVAEAVCRALGLSVSGQRQATDVAVAFLRQRTALLVLDTCEHVLPQVAALAAAILKMCPRVKLMATSREPLGIAGESVFRMPSLPLPPHGEDPDAQACLQWDGVRLFVERAREAVSSYELTNADAPYVLSICRRLDGVPMALELAASRLRMMTPAELAARLEDVFRLLTGGSKAALPHQQTLRATLDWSHDLLSPSEQILLRRLSVFVDGFSLQAATSVCACGMIDDLEILDLLTALVDKSLVIADQSGASTRYRMLKATRQYARARQDASDEAALMPRLAAFMVELYSRAEARWPTTPTEAWIAEFCPDVENLRACIDWAFTPSCGAPSSNTSACGGGDPLLGMRLVAVAGSIAEERSLAADMRRWAALAMPHLEGPAPQACKGWVLYWVTRHQSVFGVQELCDVRQRAITMFRQANDITGLSRALRSAGIALARPRGPQDEALAMLCEAESILRPAGCSKDLANAISTLGAFHYINENEPLAREYSEKALFMRRALGDRTGELISYINIAEFAYARDDAQAAIAYARQALRAARAAQVHEILATVLTNLANYLLAVDDVEGARGAATEAFNLHKALGNQDYAIVCLEHLALTHSLAGAPQHAARLFGYTDAYFRATQQTRDPAEQTRCDRLREDLAAAIPMARLEYLFEEGAAWSEEEAAAAAAPPPIHLFPRDHHQINAA